MQVWCRPIYWYLVTSYDCSPFDAKFEILLRLVRQYSVFENSSIDNMASRPGQATLFSFLKEGNQRVQNYDEILLPEEGVSQNTQNNDGMSDQSQKKQKVSFNDKWR